MVKGWRSARHLVDNIFLVGIWHDHSMVLGPHVALQKTLLSASAWGLKVSTKPELSSHLQSPCCKCAFLQGHLPQSWWRGCPDGRKWSSRSRAGQIEVKGDSGKNIFPPIQVENGLTEGPTCPCMTLTTPGGAPASIRSSTRAMQAVGSLSLG